MANYIEVQVIEIPLSRYDYLIEKAERLRLIENYISNNASYSGISEIKKILGLKEDKVND